jgi:hypothetical protein
MFFFGVNVLNRLKISLKDSVNVNLIPFLKESYVSLSGQKSIHLAGLFSYFLITTIVN